MVRLRSSGGASVIEVLDSSSDFLTLDLPKTRPLQGSKRDRSATRRRACNAHSDEDEENADGHHLRSLKKIPRPSHDCFSEKENCGRTLRSLRNRPENGQHLQSSDSSFDKSQELHEHAETKRCTRSAILQAVAKSNGKSNEETNGELKEDEKMKKTDEQTDAPIGRCLRTRSADKAERPADGDVEVRRSGRIRRSRYSTTNQSVLFDKLITNTAEAVLAKMDDMKKMRRRRMRELDDPGVFNDTETFNDTEEDNLDMYSRVKRRRKPTRVDEETTDNQDESGESSEEEDQEEDDEEEEDDDEEDDEEDEEDEEDDEDGEEDNQKRYDFRQRKAVVRYQAPLEEPRHPKKPKIFYSGPSSPVRRRYGFSSTGPRSPFRKRRSTRRRHAIHSSDSTSSSSSDEEHFERRRSRSRNKSIRRCLPLNLRKEDLKGIHKDRMKIGASLADVDPMQIDSTVRFNCIGGLANHIASLKEMVIFPLLYPEIFERFKIQPPRGCLFYGPPGTGKTLVARALANECSQGDRRVAFFMRKGADCLSKWVGESERQLRLLFDQAYQMRPSIIFFDEIDGLAPVRSSRQDQIHSSIVSTLLALMDGLDSRGEIVVIGATNRLDSIDPALRRPGRFDREFLFSLPDKDARKDILKIHTCDWNPKLAEVFVHELAEKCVGYCGADIKSVCAEAAICALRRRYPQIYTTSEKLQLDISSISITAKDFAVAMQKIVPASQRAVVSPGQALSPIIKPLLQNTLDRILEVLKRVFPHAEQGIKKPTHLDFSNPLLQSELMYSDDDGPSVFESVLSPKIPIHKQRENIQPFLQFNRSAHRQPTSYRPRLLICGGPSQGQGSHLAPAILHTLEKFTVYTLDLAVLFGVSATSPEETCAQLFREAKRTAPSILYVPHVQMWWETVSCILKATFLTLLKNIPSFTPVLLLATSDSPLAELPEEVQDLFVDDYGEVFHVQSPKAEERRAFFEDLILNQAAKPPSSKRKAVLQALEVLPIAPPPVPRPLSAEEIKRLEAQEEATFRELRLFLRDVTHRLAIDKRFRAFTKPVDPEEVPDYDMVIKQPMDLSTIISKIDLHKYHNAKDFLKDIDLICNNALEYNPDRNPSDRAIRHRACTLRDVTYAIIKDELDEDFEQECEEILQSRKKRGGSSTTYAPAYYHINAKLNVAAESRNQESELTDKGSTSAPPFLCSTPAGQLKRRKYRRKNRWSMGMERITKKKKAPSTSKNDSLISIEEDEDEEESDVAPDHLCSSMEQSELDCQGDSSMDADVENAAPNGLCSGSEKPLVDNKDEGVENAVDCQAACLQGKNKDTEILNTETTTSRVKINGHRSEIQDTGVVRMTRARHSLVEQQHLINVEKAMEILSAPVPPLKVDHQQLMALLDRVTQKSEGYNVCQLEKLYALLGQCIYRHRKSHDKTLLTDELWQEIDSFRL